MTEKLNDHDQICTDAEAFGMSLDARFREYYRKQHIFAETHKPTTCKGCGIGIMPGEDVVSYCGDPFCGLECLAEHIDAHVLIFNEDDADYKSFFEARK